ncbi:MAG TPA: hypothetical protein VHV51_02755 [Polyangiaceae bacterium]|jgi:hypothetical protein|nr:hypothetical protein [Polyangiaceae bacterium]
MTAVATGASGLIDNFDSHVAGSTLLPGGTMSDGRVGGWNIDKSPTAVSTSTAVPMMGGDGGGLALNFKGTDNITATPPGWGADAAVALAATGNCYNAMAYTNGIKISLMMGSGIQNGSVVVSVQTAEDLATNYASGPQGKQIAITNSWADYTIAWGDLMTTYGTPIPLDLKEVHAVVIATSATTAANFDVWVDNLSFY